MNFSQRRSPLFGGTCLLLPILRLDRSSYKEPTVYNTLYLMMTPSVCSSRRLGAIVLRSRRPSSSNLLSGGQCGCITAATSHTNHHNHLIKRERALIRRRRPLDRFHAFTQIRSILLFGEQIDERRPWQDPNFMNDDEPDQVEAWLISLLKSVSNDISAEYSQNNPPVSFDSTTFLLDSTIYLRVLEAYARASHISGAPQRAEYWLNHSIRHYEHARELFESKYRRKLSDVIQSNQTEESAAAAIVDGLRPNVEHYNAVIECWANSKDKISVVRSRTWLSRLEDDSSTTLQPNARSYDLYLHSVSRGIGKDVRVHLERAQEAEKILQYRLSPDAPTSIRPSTESFNMF